SRSLRAALAGREFRRAPDAVELMAERCDVGLGEMGKSLDIGDGHRQSLLFGSCFRGYAAWSDFQCAVARGGPDAGLHLVAGAALLAVAQIARVALGHRHDTGLAEGRKRTRLNSTHVTI